MYYVIINPSAGKGRAKKAAEPVERVLSESGIEYRLVYTEEPKHGTLLAAQAVEEGCDRVIAVGGDGTLREIAQALLHTDCAMGIIPAGTGNDFSKSLGIPKDFVKAARIAVSEDIHTIDVMDSGNNICINIACVGLDANAVYYAGRFKRFLKGLPAYLAGFVVSFLRYKPIEMRITIDDGEARQVRQTMMVVANGIYYGGGFKPVPMADLQNGHIDLMFTQNLSRWRIMKLLPGYVKGKHVASDACYFEQCQRITIEVGEEHLLNIDGELIPFRKETFSIIPAALKVVAPLNE